MTLTFYFDMDGVIADFERSFIEKTGKHPASVKTIDDYLGPLTQEGFFADLPPMPDMGSTKTLMYLLDSDPGSKVEILSSISDSKGKDRVRADKITWLTRHGFGGYHRNFVEHSRDKSRFASPNAILIDDRKKATEPFIKAGGSAILFTSYADLMKRLPTMIEKVRAHVSKSYRPVGI